MKLNVKARKTTFENIPLHTHTYTLLKIYVEGNGPSKILWLPFFIVKKISFRENERRRPIHNRLIRYCESNTRPPPFRVCPLLWQWGKTKRLDGLIITNVNKPTATGR